MPQTIHPKIAKSLEIRAEMLAEYEESGESWKLPVCKDCGERMIPFNIEDPEAGIWKLWMCGCPQDGEKDRQNAGFMVWSSIMDTRRKALNIAPPWETSPGHRRPATVAAREPVRASAKNNAPQPIRPRRVFIL